MYKYITHTRFHLNDLIDPIGQITSRGCDRKDLAHSNSSFVTRSFLVAIKVLNAVLDITWYFCAYFTFRYCDDYTMPVCFLH